MESANSSETSEVFFFFFFFFFFWDIFVHYLESFLFRNCIDLDLGLQT